MSPLHFANELSFFVVLLIIPLGFLGNLRYIVFPNRHRAFAAASLGFILANIAVHAMITAETRYRLFLDPLFIIWAWIAVACIFKVMQQPPSCDEDADGMDQRAVYLFKGR